MSNWTSRRRKFPRVILLTVSGFCGSAILAIVAGTTLAPVSRPIASLLLVIPFVVAIGLPTYIEWRIKRALAKPLPNTSCTTFRPAARWWGVKRDGDHVFDFANDEYARLFAALNKGGCSATPEAEYAF
jgi:hypothetical protein